jgi:arylsulfatase A-like enzyme
MRWLFALALAATLACAPSLEEEGDERPNILLISLDTVRADYLGAYDSARLTSPEFDRLAEAGALFETAYSPMGTTAPAHASLFTSKSTLAHGLVRNGISLPDRELTLAEILASHGYDTAAFVSAYPVSTRLGFSQGFDHFDDSFDEANATFRTEESEADRPWAGLQVEGAFDRRGGVTVAATLRWLKSRPKDRPLFLWVHLFDAHLPYAPPDDFADLFTSRDQSRNERTRAHYKGEVRYVDFQLGRLVAAFDQLSGRASPLTVIVSDHGEGLLDHGYRAHNRTLYDEEVRVAMLFRWVGQIAPRRFSQPVHLVDVAPTILGLLGISDDSLTHDGLNMRSNLLGDEPLDPERPIWFQRPDYTNEKGKRSDTGPGFALRVGPWKLIEAHNDEPRELYNLRHDPKEQKDLSTTNVKRANQLSKMIKQWVHVEGAKAPEHALEISPDHQDALRALGYAE